MKWSKFYSDVKDRMVVESEYLHLLYGNKNQVELQLSRWAKQEKVHRLKRGFYILGDDYRLRKIYEPYIASLLKFPSYISLEKALEMHHLIPDAVFTFTSVTPKRRPVEFINRAGRFKYVSIKREYFWGYHPVTQTNCTGYLAEPEKALIDLFYFNQRNVDRGFIQSLRLQNTEQLDPQKLKTYAEKMGVHFVMRAVNLLLDTLETD